MGTIIERNKQATAAANAELMARLCLETSLYAEMPIPKDDRHPVIGSLRKDNFQIDAFCMHCGREVVFKTAREDLPEHTTSFYSNNLLPFEVRFFCQRAQHRYSFFLQINPAGVVKLGQFPSMEDIASADINKYRSVLDKEQFANLRRAGGLNSHGIGIGAFVYLRRIFEKLIAQHRFEFERGHAPIANFETLRMADKIETLKAVLPPALVQHRSAYGILSQGVHELDEATCLKHFPVVRAAIILMLEQDLQDLEKKRAEAELLAAMGRVHQELSASPEPADERATSGQDGD